MALEYYRMLQLIGTPADWSANDIVIGSGEIAFQNDAGVITGKIGNGVDVFSALPFSISGASIPLAGTTVDEPVTGMIVHEQTAVNKEFAVGIKEGSGVDDFIIEATGANVVGSNVWISINSNDWIFQNDGFITAPDVTYTVAQDLTLANKKYVDAAVAGGVSGDFIPLAGTGVQPVTGIIGFENVTVDKEYNFGIFDTLGFEDLILSSTGTNSINCNFGIIMNSYSWLFNNDGRLVMPDIVYGTTDSLVAANKKFVDQLRQDCIDAGVAIPPVV